MGTENEHNCHHALKQPYRSRKVILMLSPFAPEASAINKCVDNVAHLVDQRAVKVEDLIEAGVEQITDAKDRQNDDNR